MLDLVLLASGRDEIVVLQSLEKHKLFNLLPLTLWAQVLELLEFLVLDATDISGLDEASGLGTDVVWDLEVRHDGVDVVQTILKSLLLLVQLRYQVGHLTKNIGVSNGRKDHHDHDADDFVDFNWGNLVQTKDHESVVENSHILL
jgi:hypothetical protein